MGAHFAFMAEKLVDAINTSLHITHGGKIAILRTRMQEMVYVNIAS